MEKLLVNIDVMINILPPEMYSNVDCIFSSATQATVVNIV